MEKTGKLSLVFDNSQAQTTAPRGVLRLVSDPPSIISSQGDPYFQDKMDDTIRAYVQSFIHIKPAKSLRRVIGEAFNASQKSSVLLGLPSTQATDFDLTCYVEDLVDGPLTPLRLWGGTFFENKRVPDCVMAAVIMDEEISGIDNFTIKKTLPKKAREILKQARKLIECGFSDLDLAPLSVRAVAYSIVYNRVSSALNDLRLDVTDINPDALIYAVTAQDALSLAARSGSYALADIHEKLQDFLKNIPCISNEDAEEEHLENHLREKLEELDVFIVSEIQDATFDFRVDLSSYCGKVIALPLRDLES